MSSHHNGHYRGSVGVRGSLLLVLLLIAGGAGGWAYAEQTSSPSISDVAPTPLAAADPAIPYTPPEKTKPDPEIDPLPTSLPTHDEKVGTPGIGGVIVPVPDGWVRTRYADPRIAKWTLPDGVSGGYTFRVQLLDENRTVGQKVDVRPRELRGDPAVSDIRVLDKSFDTLKASFILSGYRRLTVIRWVSFSGGLADVEIAATGRLQDENGLEALVATIDREIRLQPERQKPGASTPSRTS